MSKTEDRLKIIIKEYLHERELELENKIVGKAAMVFLWGFICGVLFAYTSLAPLTIGVIAGFAIAKNNLPFVDTCLTKIIAVINQSQEFVFPKI